MKSQSINWSVSVACLVCFITQILLSLGNFHSNSTLRERKRECFGVIERHNFDTHCFKVSKMGDLERKKRPKIKNLAQAMAIMLQDKARKFC